MQPLWWRNLSQEYLESIRDRFFSYVEVNANEKGCDLWTGATGKGGYGQLTLHFCGKQKAVSAHHLGFQFAKGEITLDASVFVLHTCDNPPCVKGEHLYLGNAKRNSMDMMERNRCNPPKGNTHPHAVLNEAMVRQIMVDSRPANQIAADFGVSSESIAFVRVGRSWSHITGITERPGYQTGEKRYNARLNEQQVREIRDDPRVHRIIAEQYGVGAGTIWKIKNRIKWAHVVDLPLAA